MSLELPLQGKSQVMLCTIALLLVGVLGVGYVWVESTTPPGGHFWDYIVVGAGPAGLQMGYHLQTSGRDYVILERGNTSGHFFTQYPRHDRLISINKRNTGKTNKEFNLRHDWNSLLSHDERLLFKEFSRDFFPHRSSMVDYLKSFTRHFALNVLYNRHVSQVTRRRTVNDSTGESVFQMRDQEGRTYTCRHLIIATGIWKPNIPAYDGIEYTSGYESISTNPEDYEAKTVLVLGHGNAAFETADAIYGHANGVHMAGRSRVRLAWETHYVGDLRGVNNALLDTYQLKSLDGVVEGPFRDVRFERKEGKIHVKHHEDSSQDNFALRETYDIVIRCLGFLFDDSIFTNGTKPMRASGKKYKYPLISADYKVVGVPGMHVTGTAAHSLDFRRSAGGFIHGFRYNVRVLHRLLEWQNHGNPWPSTRISYGDLLPYVAKRMNEASGTYQMFGELGDILAFRPDHQVEIFEEIPMALLPRFETITGRPLKAFLVLIMQYGRNFSGPGKDVFGEARATGFANEAHRSNFLHPVLYHFLSLPSEEEMSQRPAGWPLPRPHRLHHVVEDFLTSWDAPQTHILPLRRFLEVTVGHDLRAFFSTDCLKMALTHTTIPHSCQTQFLIGRGLLNMNGAAL